MHLIRVFPSKKYDCGSLFDIAFSKTHLHQILSSIELRHRCKKPIGKVKHFYLVAVLKIPRIGRQDEIVPFYQPLVCGDLQGFLSYLALIVLKDILATHIS